MTNASKRANARAMPADRRAFLRGTLAASTVAATGAAASAEAIPEPPAMTVEQWAACEFGPIDAATLAEFKPPTNEVWVKEGIENLLIPARIAWITVNRSKAEQFFMRWF